MRPMLVVAAPVRCPQLRTMLTTATATATTMDPHDVGGSAVPPPFRRAV